MKILALDIENVKRISVVHIEPTGNIVEITGKNGAGKSSILDSIFWTIAGAKAIQSAPIKKGATKARIRLDLGELILTRTFADKDGGYTTSLRVETPDGASFGKGQDIANSLFGSLSFDPLAFSRMKPREQFDELRKFVPGVDFDAVDRQNKGDFDKRTLVNSRAKELRAQAAGVALPEDQPTERIDASELMAALERASETNTMIERERAARESKLAQIVRTEEHAGGLRVRAADLRAQADRLDQEAAGHDTLAAEQRKAHEALTPLPAPVNAGELRKDLEAASAHNAVVDRLERKQDLIADAEAAETESADLTAAMKKREADKRAAVAAAKMPVEGIEFGDGIVLLNGVPIQQSSSAEQIRTSMAIGMAMNPKLKVLLVRDGSLLDESGMGLIAKMAAETDFQFWVERVNASATGAFVMEDGHVRQ